MARKVLCAYLLYVVSGFHSNTLIWIRNITSTCRHLSTKIFWLLTDSIQKIILGLEG